MSANGKEKVPAIVERIEKDDGDDPRTRAALIWVLKDIDLECNCVGTNPSVMESLEANRMPVKETDLDGFRGFKLLYDEHLEDMKKRALDSSVEPEKMRAF